MSPQLEELRHAAEQAEHGRSLEAAVRDGVLRGLGRPPGLWMVRARRVYGDKYRVDVFVGAGPGSARITHSYFVAADGSGKILSATPALTREY